MDIGQLVEILQLYIVPFFISSIVATTKNCLHFFFCLAMRYLAQVFLVEMPSMMMREIVWLYWEIKIKPDYQWSLNLE